MFILYLKTIYSQINFTFGQALTNTGLFISPSGTSELDCATTKTYMAEKSISIGRESLKVFCTRGLGVLAGSTARGSRYEKWRAQ